MDGAMFLAHVQKVLVPGLGRGDLVICDNLSSHKVGGVREAIEGCGAQLLYLHAYSQDLNPIGPAFAKLKAFLRQRAPLSSEPPLTPCSPSPQPIAPISSVMPTTRQIK